MAPPGLWRIRMRNAVADVPVRFDAWIQRDEPVWGAAPASVQSYFEWASAGVTLGGAAGGLSNLATGRTTIVVGAASAEDGRLTRYSSLGGRSRRNGKGEPRDIDAAAPADESQTVVGLLAAGVRSFTLTRMGGTSVAAPVAARRICNELAPAIRKSPPTSTPQGLVEQVRNALAGWRVTTPRGRGSVPLLRPDGGPPPHVAAPISVPAVFGKNPSLRANSTHATARMMAWLRRMTDIVVAALTRRRAPPPVPSAPATGRY